MAAWLWRAFSTITPFTLAVPQADLEDLNRRIDRTRWPDAETVDDWTQGHASACGRLEMSHDVRDLRLGHATLSANTHNRIGALAYRASAHRDKSLAA
jgi:hypothetical protein